MGRLVAICGWLAWHAGRPFGRAPSVRRAVPAVLAALLVVLAFVPIVLPMLDPQPEDATVGNIRDGEVQEADGWVRLTGEIVPLPGRPVDEPGRYALLVDAANQLDAVVLRSSAPTRHEEATVVTGHVQPAAVVLPEEEVPFEATLFGAPPAVVPDRIVELDAAAQPERVTWWPLAIPPLLLAAVLVVGGRAGYPLFRPIVEVDVLTSPLAPGERLPGVWGGRLGPNRRDLGDPGAVLFVVRPGPKGNVLTAQPLPDEGGPAPAPVPIGGGSTVGRIGDVHTIRETVPALRVRAEDVDATFLFAKRGERDRVASLIAVERG
jgi:hypothetical protein